MGKSNLLSRFTRNEFSLESKSTIGVEFATRSINVDGKTIKAQIWDTAGQEKFQSLGYAFYRGADCCALVYDITNQASYDNLSRWKAGFIENAGPSDPHNFPFVCLANKLDQEALRQVPRTKGEEWAKENNNMMFFETSAV